MITPITVTDGLVCMLPRVHTTCVCTPPWSESRNTPPLAWKGGMSFLGYAGEVRSLLFMPALPVLERMGLFPVGAAAALPWFTGACDLKSAGSGEANV